MSDTTPISGQIASNAPIPQGLVPVTAPLLPDQGVLAQMSNFPAETYNKTMGSSIVKLMSTLTGASGGGQLRQRSLVDRLRSSVSSTYYTDLDNSLGMVLGISRQLGESLPINPYTTAAPSTGPASWLAMAEADATYRDRLFQVLRAVSTYGPTLQGIQLIAESFLLSPVEVTEYYRLHSVSYLAANPTQAYYIVVTPHITPTPQQRYGLMKILNKIKPALSTITLAAPPAVEPYVQVNLRGASASSFYWEVQSISSSPSIYGNTSVPQYAFGSSQAAAWTVNGWVSGVLSYANDIFGVLYSPTDFEQITWADGTITNYSPLYAMAPASEAVLGTMVIPGNASANPLNTDNSTVSDILLSGASISAIQSASTITAQSIPQFWSTPERDYTDMTSDIIEVRFSSPVNLNAVSFQLANFPHTATFQVYDDTAMTWVAYYTQTVATSVPGVLPNPSAALVAKTHPQHYGPGHWVPVGFRFAPTSFDRARIVLVRPGISGPTGPISAMTGSPTPYSLGVTEFSFDYVVDSADQLPDSGTVSLETIGSSTDVAGNTITYSVYSEVPTVTNGTLDQWRCFPQPVNNAVALLYLDTRDSSGNAQTIDRFFVTPTHLGVACTLYFAIDEPTTPGDMTTVNWILVNRQYMLMTGWMVVPPIAAKYWKFEMSGLVAEPLSNPFPVTADTLLFGTNAITPIVPSAGYQGALPPGAATQAGLAAGEPIIATPVVNPPASGPYSPATALVAADPTLAQMLQANFANYGYIDWQPFGAPPVTLGGFDSYTVSTVSSVNMVGFFTGFSSIVAYRSNPACPIDTPLYIECFYDASQIASSNGVTEGGIYSGIGIPPYPDNNPQAELLATPVVVTSNAYVSASMVNKVQFATVQSPPAEIVPFDTFRNGRYLPQTTGSYTWDDQSDWNIVGMGDVQIAFNPQTLTPLVERGLTAYSGPQANGIVSGPFQTSPKGFIAFAVRLSVISVPPGNPEFFAEYPIYLQLCEWFGSGTPPHVVVEWPLSVSAVGQTVEEFFSYQVGSAINSGTFLCLAVAQHSGAKPPTGQSASWVVQAASGFDPSIIWSFSCDNVNWVDADSVNPVRNNRNGVVSMYTGPSTNLYWRCTLYRPDLFVTNLKIRPWYQGTNMPRQAPIVAGPNMSYSDPEQTIWTDPEFNTWTLPVPMWWFARYQQNVGLFPEGVPIITSSSKIYGQEITETVGPAHDTAQVTFYMQMYQSPQVVGPATDVSKATVYYHATVAETVGPASDNSLGTILVSPHTTVFNYTGGLQQFTVPAGCQSITASMAGGGGGGSSGGVAGIVNFTFPVTIGQVLNVYVGGQGGTYSSTAGAGWPYGYHVGGAPYDLLSNNLTYGGPGNYGTVGFGGGSSAVTLSNGSLVAEAGGGGGQGWLYGVSETSYSQTFNYTGTTQTFTVPPNVSGGTVTVTVAGSGGGASTNSGNPGGVGGQVTATIPVTTGEVLTIYVANKGPDGLSAPGGPTQCWGYHIGGATAYGFGIGAGGGSSAILSGGTLLVEAGGGGASGNANGPATGGNGGNPNGGNGAYGGGFSAIAGIGATQSGPGIGLSSSAQNGTADGPAVTVNGGATGVTYNSGGGGGGGGYNGGSGGWGAYVNPYPYGSGGGGGSSWAGNGVSNVTYGLASTVADGAVTVTYNQVSVVQTFNYTGGAQTFTCPSNPQGGTVTITAQGGSGGYAGYFSPGSGLGTGAAPGAGGVVTCTLPVSPGQVLTVYVGGAGIYGGGGGVATTGGYHLGYQVVDYYNGGGGNSSAVLSGSTLLVEAGAGGGGGGTGGAAYFSAGGAGGGSGTPNGATAPATGGAAAIQGGGGATQSAGGQPQGGNGNFGAAGTLDGAVGSTNGGAGNNFGGAGYGASGGGGGGGFAGGGGGGTNYGDNVAYSSGGGGGSSWAGNGATVSSWGVAGSLGNGSVTITYTPGTVASTAYNAPIPAGAGGAPGAGSGTGQNFGSASAGGGGGATQSSGGFGGTWTSVQPSGTTSGTSNPGTFDGAILTNGTNGGVAYPFSGGGGGGGGYAGGGAGGYAVYIATNAWNTNMWGGGGGGSSWAGGIATSISYGRASSPANGTITFNYLSNN